MARRSMIAGNWKMFKTPTETMALIKELLPLVADVKHRDIAVIPPFPCLYAAKEALKGSRIMLGAQNIHHEEQGAYTGEVSVSMIKDLGCAVVIIGHSERRQYFYEESGLCNLKIKRAFAHQLASIYCVGETLHQREEKKTFEVVLHQLREGLEGLTAQQLSAMVIAYEPVWAIGTGKTATPQQAQEVHNQIRKYLIDVFGPDAAQQCRILYGGSVKPDNIDELMAQPDIDGALVGGASLAAKDFARIVNYL